MQRQIHFLKHTPRKGAFALIAAVFLMLMISIMMLKMLSYSADESNRVTNDYLLEQAQLVAYGATEYAMLQVSTDDRTAACTKKITMTYPSPPAQAIFDVNVTIQYIWSAGSAPGGTDCGNSLVTGTPVSVGTAEQNGSAYVLVEVSSKSNLNLDEPIRYIRKTLQKL